MLLPPSPRLEHFCFLPADGLGYRSPRYGCGCCGGRGRRGLAVRVRYLRNLYGSHLEERLLGDRVPLGYGQFVGRPGATVGRVPTGLVEVPVVERREDYAFSDPAYTGLRLHPAARG